MASSKLQEYKRKRDFTKTSEPKPLVKKGGKNSVFVVQQHHASHMHFDLRLELDGVLKSWAIPKGPSTDPRQKRLAMETEDHPLDYASFEGIIPSGYGAGTVIVWDHGTYKNVTEHEGKAVPLRKALEKGHAEIELFGKKLHGRYALIKFRGEKAWLFVKVKDAYADARRNPVSTEPESVISGITIKELDKQFIRPKKASAKK